MAAPNQSRYEYLLKNNESFSEQNGEAVHIRCVSTSASNQGGVQPFYLCSGTVILESERLLEHEDRFSEANRDVVHIHSVLSPPQNHVNQPSFPNSSVGGNGRDKHRLLITNKTETHPIKYLY